MRSLLLLAIASCSPAASSATESPVAPTTAKLDHPGCFTIYDRVSGRHQSWGSQSCTDRTSPASTFKIPHALVGLQTGVIAGPDAVFAWDPKKYEWAPWGREDQTLVTAIRQSVLWYFMEVAEGLGRDREQEFLTACYVPHYPRDFVPSLSRDFLGASVRR